LNIKHDPGDIFIITYPRSGTHWISVIVYTLLTNGQPFNKDMKDYLSRVHFIDRFGKEAAEKMVRPCVIQTHFPFNYVPYNSKSKYIAVIRHPKDICVSFYQLLYGNSQSESSNVDFNTFFFEEFLIGKTAYMDYFEYLRSIWPHKDDENVLLVSYEQMKQDLRGIIEKLAQFLDIDLINNKQLLDQVEKYSSLEYMKKSYNSSFNDVLTQRDPGEHTLNIVRKGIIGDWRSLMTDEQSRKFDAVVAEKTQDIKGLDNFWFPSSN
jgi:sulfotransferase family protein